LYYVYEGVGSDETGDGTLVNPWGSIAYALTQTEEGDQLAFRSKLVARNLPNPGIGGVPQWATVRFVDPSNGTDDESHGKLDGGEAWASLQYALDHTDCGEGGEGHAWIFCKGSEQLTTTIDVDSGAVCGHWKIVEGYSTSPRDGGYYTVDGQGSVGTAIRWADVDGVLLANLKLQNFTGSVVDLGAFGRAGSDSGMVCWNIWSVAASGQASFYCINSSSTPVLLFCRAEAGNSGSGRSGQQRISADMGLCHGGGLLRR
jgi:hypothetical protein